MPWPGERDAFDRFLRRRAGRGSVVAAAAGLALVVPLGAAVLVARVLPEGRDTVAPTGGVVRVPDEGFELPVPAGWKVERELTGTRPGPAGGPPRPAVVGVCSCPGRGSHAARRSPSAERSRDVLQRDRPAIRRPDF